MAKKTWRCKVCKEKNDIGDLECVATENCDGVRPKPRVVTNPAQYTIFGDTYGVQEVFGILDQK